MFKRLLGVGMLSWLVVATGAHAAGVNLRWNNCASEGGVANRTFACNTNLGSQAVVASLVLPAPQLGVDGIEVDIDVSAAGGTIPPWWALFTIGSCRQTALSANPVMNGNNLICQDWAQGQAAVGIASYTIGTFGPSSARIVSASNVAFTNRANLLVGPEYFVENFLISNTKTVGSGLCSGCTVPVCLGIESVKVFSGSTPLITLTQPANGTDSNFATWQGGIGAPPLPGGSCPAVVPTRSSTWGSVKSLYR